MGGSMKIVRKGVRDALKVAKNAQFDAYIGGSPGNVLVAVFDCQGCEPSRLISCGPVTMNTEHNSYRVENLSLESGWVAPNIEGDNDSLPRIDQCRIEFSLV